VVKKKQRQFFRPLKNLFKPPPPAPVVITGYACPFCGSKDITTLPESDRLMARSGCCTCNRWFTEEREKKR